ncbi:MAG: hypothetical protein OXK82_11940 [Deltaproteobacteria bacterium]|nr:hypothetical protein [Deltaproteobacteria bacterium]
MSRPLTLHLTPRHIEAIDRITAGSRGSRPGDRDRRRAIERLILEYASEPQEPARVQNASPAPLPGGGLPDSANAQRKVIRTIDRLRESRDRYRDLALRAEAALLGVPVRDDAGAIERRLERALQYRGFSMPAASGPRRSAGRRRTGNRRSGGR